ncbi:LuxR C-terminal-related transcriptional regulator [Leucobacter albus]|uniref:LuxR C-terminal-related transcriptional regulator n=1 Tax=Leucobacter albus TaxID=272210 RepID=A0ABW3TMD3_9MICO
MRVKEVDKLLEHIRRHESVRMIASREFGRTTVLDELETALNALGFSAVRMSGDPSLSELKYAALRQAMIAADRFTPHATPGEVTDALAVELASTPNSVLLIDDAEWLDLHSAQALAPLLQRPQLSSVIVTAPFRQLTKQQRLVSLALRADARVELPALSFEQVGVLAERMLDGQVSPDLTSEVFSMSSGITGVAADILRSGQATGVIRLTAGRWSCPGGELWNGHLEESVERLLAPLDETSIRLLHSLSLVGNLTAEQFHRFDLAASESLTSAGLITVFRDPHGNSRVSPRPALIADYFRRRPIDLLHIAASELVQGPTAPAARSQFLSGSQQTPPSHAHFSDSEETHNAGLARFMREQAEWLLSHTAREWRRYQDVPRAIDYLETLLRSGGYVATAVEILEATPADRATGPELLQLALHEFVLRGQGCEPDTDYETRLRASHAEYAPGFDAYVAYVTFCDEGRVPAVNAWLAAPGDDPLGFAATFVDYVLLASGDQPRNATGELPQAALPFQRVISEQNLLITRIRQAALDDALDDLIANPLSLNPGDDPVPFLMHSYVRSQLLLGLGRVSEARRVLSQALSVGDLDLRYAVLYAAMLRWSAFLHHRDGRSDIAQSLLSESRAYDGARGPMPGMRPEFGDCLEVLFSQNRPAAGNAFLAEARACMERGFYYSAWSMARFAFQLTPSAEAINLLDQIAQHPSHAWISPIVDFARAATRQDPGIIQHIARFRGLPELAAAADFLEDIDFAHRQQGRLPSEAYASAYDEALQSFAATREPLSRVVYREQAPGVAALTPREREIAPLTATLSNREIADRLTLSIRTVENHIARSMKKLGIGSRTELSAVFRRTAVDPARSTSAPRAGDQPT